MKKSYFQLLSCLLLWILSLGLYAQHNPHKAPLYWSVYENNYVKETQHVQDNYISEEEWLTNINWVEEHLKHLGYNMICIDGWGDVSQYNQYGYRTSHSRHWKHDYAWWSDYLQRRGMTLGMYGNPLWINKDAAAAGAKIKGTDIPLSNIIDYNEETLWFTWVQVDRPGAEEYVKGYVQHYADMGIKYFRVDFLSWYETGHDQNMNQRVGPKRPREHYETALRWMREACDANGMFLSLVMPHLYEEAALETKYGHMVRINEDTGDGAWWKWSDNARGVRRAGWSQYANAVDGITYWSHIAGRNKMILDADFIRLNTFTNNDEKKSVISACLMSGGPVTVADQHNTIGKDLWLYQNKELLALNHDGFVGKPLTNDPTDERSQTWKGQLSNGDWVVGFFNRENTAKTRNINFAADLGVKGDAYVRDLWRHEDVGQMLSYSVSVPQRGCVIVKISKNKPTQVNAPTFSQAGGVYTTAQTVTLTSTTPGAKIYYTLNGSEPTTVSALYTGPITVTQTATVKAVAIKNSLNNSHVVAAAYTINLPGPLPSPWQSTDIGAVNAAGSATFGNGIFTNTGSGEDIEGTADNFQFIYQTIEGDATITARVASMSGTHDWAKAGIIIRESLEANAPNAFMAVTPANGGIFQSRSDTGGGTNGLLTSGVAAPVWIRLQRVGNQFTAFRSVDGNNWVQAGTPVTFSMGATVQAGLAFTSHETGTFGAATFDQVEVGHTGNAAAVPVFSLSGGTYQSEQTVSLSTTSPGATIHYTTNGTVPNSASLVYAGPIQITSTTTIKAVAAAAGKVSSPVASSTFTLAVPNTAILSGGIYKLLARHSSKVLDVVGGSEENGAKLHQWDDYELSSQQWKIEYLDNGFYRLTAQHSQKVLDVAGGSLDEGANVHQWNNYELPSQQWCIAGTADGYMKIQNRNSGKVLNVYEASPENGGAVKQTAYTGEASQQWQLEFIGATPSSDAMYIGGSFNSWTLGYTPMALDNGVWKTTGVYINAGEHQLKFANSNNWSGADWGNATGLAGTASLTTGGGANISFSTVISGTYTITFDEQSLVYAIVQENAVADGVYAITARHSGKALDVVDGSKDNGALVHQWDFFGGSSQQWQVKRAGDDYYTITNLHSRKAMDVAGGSQDEGAAIHQWDSYPNFPSQQWRFVPAGDGYFSIENRNSGKVLDIYGASQDNGAAVNQYLYTATAHQQFAMQPIAQTGIAAQVTAAVTEHLLTLIYRTLPVIM